MARGHPDPKGLGEALERKRRGRKLTYEALARVADVHLTTAFRVCRGDFKTLHQGVLRVCKALHVSPDLGQLTSPEEAADPLAAMLQAEVIRAWDRSERSADILKRVLRALRPR